MCQVKFAPIYTETPDLTEVLVGLLTCLKTKKPKTGLALTGVGPLHGKTYLLLCELKKEFRSLCAVLTPAVVVLSSKSVLAVEFMKHSL
jgi:hypothetical protein